ncbi:restriction endonuclease subunit S [Klebsiella pneumoniae subsp. pneumoniae]|nr:restriction endonuclease subunit S [Klebsiella pneumoniae subsp. pneumoniae]
MRFFSDQEIEKFSLEKGDLLLIRSNGSLSLVGSCALVDDKDTSYLFAGYLLRLRPISEFIHPRFLMYLLASPMLRMQIENVAKSSSGVNNINAQEIRSLIIPICSLEEQMEIVNILDGIKDSIKSQQNYLNLLIDKAGLTKKNILEEAFTIGFESQPIETSDIDKYIDNIKTTKAKLIAEAKKRKPKAIRKKYDKPVYS